MINKLKTAYLFIRRLSFLVLTTISFLYFSFARSNHRNKEVSRKKITEINIVNDAVRDEMSKQEIVGCAVSVIENGEVVHVKAYGHTSPARTTPITVSTVFRWASVSKPLTAIAALKLVENGRLSLDDKVADKVRYWPTDGNKGDISVRHLLTHRSGINHYSSFNPLLYVSSRDFNAEQCVNVFKNSALLFNPGEQHLYTTFGYNLLGAVIEEAAGVPYERFILENIANVVGMSSLVPYSNDPGGWGKDCNGRLISKTEPLSPEWKLPGGGWASNIQDMGAFVKGILDGSFLQNSSKLWEAVDDNSRFGFGLIRRSFNGERYVSHAGQHDDVMTYIAMYPESESKLGIAVMANSNDQIDIDRLGKRIEEAMGKARTESTFNPVNNCGNNNDCGMNTVGIWHKTNATSNNIIRRGFTGEDFWNERLYLKEIGYECVDFETYDDWGTRRWDGIFKKTNNPSKIWGNASSESFLEKWNEFYAEGYKLTDIETYWSGNSQRWAGLFVRKEGRQTIHRNLTAQALRDKDNLMKSQRMRLSALKYNEGRWVGVWDVGTPNHYYCINVNSQRFREIRLYQNSIGRRLVDVETYMVGLERKWAGVWVNSAVQEKFAYGKKYCDFLNTYHIPNQNNGYELIDMETY